MAWDWHLRGGYFLFRDRFLSLRRKKLEVGNETKNRKKRPMANNKVEEIQIRILVRVVSGDILLI